MISREQIEQLQRRLKELEGGLASPDIVMDTTRYVALSKEYTESKYIADTAAKLQKITEEIKDSENLLREGADEAMKEMIEQELFTLKKHEEDLAQEISEYFVPSNSYDKKDVIVEIRGGTGGDEASLFAAELFRMYSLYCEQKKWKVILVSMNRTDVGGVKEVIFEVQGSNVYRYLKYESGVHRVQRVPETEKSGRVHTSAATVAVLPKAEEVDVTIDPKELRIDTFCAGGHGGQSVNTTYSAVRITHIPTNTVVSCQDERSQLQNKERAMTILRSRLLQIEMERQAQAIASMRKGMVGTGDRSEKIRTYNFPQDRITDHRIKKSWHNMHTILDGGLDDVIASLKTAELNGFEATGENDEE